MTQQMTGRPAGDSVNDKYAALLAYLRGLGSVAIAFSGGVDSTFLLAAAREALGDNVLAVTASSPSFPGREREEAVHFCEDYRIRHCVVETDELSLETYRSNPPDRCYLCKRRLMGRIMETAAKQGIRHVAEASNMDDNGDYRPGLRAVAELGILSPLREAGLTKQEIRGLSRQLHLPTWDKPSYACLASRFVYGEPITEEKLQMVGKAEQLLMDLDFKQMRVRIHGRMARIEVLPQDLPKILQEPVRSRITQALHEYGFTYVSLDLDGYRTGSMNEVLGRQVREAGLKAQTGEGRSCGLRGEDRE